MNELIQLSEQNTSLATINFSPAQVHQACKIVRVSSGDDQNMPQLMAMSDQVEFPRQPSLRYPQRIHSHSDPVERQHHNLIRGRDNSLRPIPKRHHLVHYGHQPWQAHARKQPCSNHCELWSLEHGHQRDKHAGYAEDSDEAHVEIAREGVTDECVVDQWVEWGDD